MLDNLIFLISPLGQCGTMFPRTVVKYQMSKIMTGCYYIRAGHIIVTGVDYQVSEINIRLEPFKWTLLGPEKWKCQWDTEKCPD